MLNKEEIDCKWLNKTFGKGYYICSGLLKAVTEEDCKNCEERIEKNVE